jgi:hypothetical protein
LPGLPANSGGEQFDAARRALTSANPFGLDQRFAPGKTLLDSALGAQTGTTAFEGNGNVNIDINAPNAGKGGAPRVMFNETMPNRASQMDFADPDGVRAPILRGGPEE